MAALNFLNVVQLPHHEKKVICASRAKYREGRKDTSVKVYTINQESVYLLVQGVPAVGVQDDLCSLFEQYGILDDFKPLDEYPCEEFTEVYVVKYNWFSAARIAKKFLDDKSFFGGTLHVCYAPEFETVADTRQKLNERRKFVAWRVRVAETPGDKSSLYTTCSEVKRSSRSLLQNQKLNYTTTHTDVSSHQPITYVWAGKEYTVFPKSSETINSELHSENSSTIYAAQSTGNAQSTAVGENYASESSYSGSMTNIRKTVKSVHAPNMKVGFKRRRKI